MMKPLAKKIANENFARCLTYNKNAFQAERQKPSLPETAMKANADLLM